MIYNSTPAQEKGLKEFNKILREVAAEGFMIGVRKGFNNMRKSDSASQAARMVYVKIFPEMGQIDAAHKFIDDYPEEFEVSKILAEIVESGCRLNISEASMMCRYICQFLNSDYASVDDEIMVLLRIYLKDVYQEVRDEVTPWMVFHDL